jgi:hypothetical protein
MRLSCQLPLNLSDRDLDNPPAKVALGRIVFGTFFLMLLQPGAGQGLVEGKGLATTETLDVEHF